MNRFPVTQNDFLRERQKLVKYQVATGLVFFVLFFLTNSLISPENLGISFRISVISRLAVIILLTVILIQLPIILSYKLSIRCPKCGQPLLPSYRSRNPIDNEGHCSKCGEKIITNPMSL